MPDRHAWDPWLPEVIAERLAGVAVPWCVAAGWALDLFLDRQTREHHDVEIAVPAGRFAEIRDRFGDCDFYVPVRGKLVPYTSQDSGVRRPSEGEAAAHQTWALERVTGTWRVDVFREPHDGDTWICRRDDRIRRPYAAVVRRTAGGVPYLAPEVVLLFKAKAPRAKDEADFDNALPVLTMDSRRWLDGALALVHPDHPWRRRLA